MSDDNTRTNIIKNEKEGDYTRRLLKDQSAEHSE